MSFAKLILDSLKKHNEDEVAMIDADTGDSKTYRDILEDSVHLAWNLKECGVRAKDVVCIVSENNLSYCIPLLASIYIGAAVQPLNPDYTIDEFEFAVNKTKAKIIFTSNNASKTVFRLRERCSFIQEVIVFGPKMIEYEGILKNKNNSIGDFQIEKAIDMDQVVLIMSSSGTTGFPKGVMLTHKNMSIMNDILSSPQYQSMEPNEVATCLLPFFHIYGLCVLLYGIVNSMKGVVMQKLVPDLYFASIERYKITKLYLVPQLAHFLSKHPINSNLSTVKDIICGGGLVSKDISETLEKKLKLPPARQAYGLTETTGVITFIPKKKVKPGSCGIISSEILAKIVDLKTQQTLGANEHGEFCVKGPTLMKGYIGDEEATRLCVDKDGYFHTGDIAYIDDEGYLYIVGRIKELIKYKGFQVPPAELEDLLCKHPSVKEAVVIGKPDEKVGELPLAFVVKQNNWDVSETELIQFVAERISLQKRLHGGVIFVKEIPKNATGKVLRRKLKEMLVSIS